MAAKTEAAPQWPDTTIDWRPRSRPPGTIIDMRPSQGRGGRNDNQPAAGIKAAVAWPDKQLTAS